MKNIIILEDETNLFDKVQKYFNKQGVNVTSTRDFSQAYDMVPNNNYSLAVIDDDGRAAEKLHFIEYLNDVSYATRIIVIANDDSPDSRIMCYEKGADDCVGRPIYINELMWKIKSLLKKEKIIDKEFYRLNNTTLYPETGTLLLGEEKKHLRRKESEILSCLYRRKNTVVTRDLIRQTVWPVQYEQPEDVTIDVYIRRIRILMGDYKDTIRTIRGFGYSACEFCK